MYKKKSKKPIYIAAAAVILLVALLVIVQSGLSRQIGQKKTMETETESEKTAETETEAADANIITSGTSETDPVISVDSGTGTSTGTGNSDTGISTSSTYSSEDTTTTTTSFDILSVSTVFFSYVGDENAFYQAAFEYILGKGYTGGITGTMSSYEISPENQTATIRIMLSTGGTITGTYNKSANTYSFSGL